MIDAPLVRWMLGLERLPADAESVRLAWTHPVPAWMAAAACFLALGAAWLSYRGIHVAPRHRRVLCALRAATILLLAALLAGPVLEVPRESVDPDSVIVLADRSRSMTVEDVPGPGGTSRSRDAALRELAAAAGPFSSVGDEHRVEWLAFGDGTTPLRAGAAGIEVGDPTADRTLLASAVEQAIDRSPGRAIAAIVLLTDGRTTEPPDRALVRRLQAEGIAVSAVALGAPAALGDAAIASVQSPRRAFPKDIVPVEAVVERRGPARTRPLRAELVDLSTGTVLDAAELAPLPAGDAPSREPVQLVARPTAAGDARWEVRLALPDGARDLLPANDRRAIPVTLVDRPLRVLYVEGYPRWEYRYLKNMLQREQSTESAVMLLSADRDFAQEGNTPISRLPRTREEFDRFDLFVLGDLPSSFFSGEQLSELRRAVAERGAGLVWIGGERSTPRSWGGTALEELLPFLGPLELERLAEPVHLRPTPLAARLGVLRLSDDPKGEFPQELSGGADWAALEWVQRIAPRSLKPTAEVLAESVPGNGDEPAPIVVSMRYGAGTAVYVATDEVWRWRHGRGETYPERFWVQMLRSLARPALGSGREEVRLSAEPARAAVGDTVRVEVELPPGMPAGSVALEAVPEDAARPPEEFDASPLPGGGFAGQWMPGSEGRWTIRPRDPALAARAGRGAAVEPVRNDRELRDAESDRALLATLAAETGGRVVDASDAASLVQSLPNRSVRIENPVRDPIWSSPAALAAVLALLASEWALRRAWRLA